MTHQEAVFFAVVVRVLAKMLPVVVNVLDYDTRTLLNVVKLKRLSQDVGFYQWFWRFKLATNLGNIGYSVMKVTFRRY